MSRKSSLPKLIVLLGPTASGKTSWSLDVAKKIEGEIISADSRQIYKRMDIGTAKEPGDWKWRTGWNQLPRKTYMIDDVPHHMMDFLDPGKRFTVAEFREKALKYVKMSHANKRVPMVVGGTGLYIQSLVDNFSIPKVAPNQKLRDGFGEKTTEELVLLLTQLDPAGAVSIDTNNRRRLIRALEVCIFTGVPWSEQQKKGEQLFDTLQIGIRVERNVLYNRINMRVDDMMKQGLLEEVEALVKRGYPWHLPSMSGVGYRQFRGYLDGSKTLDETIELLKRDTRRYARRQLTWFRRDKRVVWCDSLAEAQEHVQTFLEK
jgi:tRNA dimethylallyltransferase